MSETKSIQVILDVELWGRVRSRALLEHRTAASVTAEALERWLGGAVRAPGAVGERTVRVVERASGAVVAPRSAPRLEPEVAAETRAAEPVCRCGHVQSAHWAKGCVGPCPCALGRFHEASATAGVF